jgi:ArsR family transcriptional regulator, arsenate/arsenite/antimonite-responsive transcriptional repressor
MESDFDLAKAFKALANPNRLAIFEIIRKGHIDSDFCGNAIRPEDIPSCAVCVCEITGKMRRVTMPTISHHLKELREASLVEVCHRGQWSYYSVHDKAIRKMTGYLSDDKENKQIFQEGKRCGYGG